MTDRDRDDEADDEADEEADNEPESEPSSGIPDRSERSERGEPELQVTESGRHVTNRNVVPRSALAGQDSGPRALPGDEGSAASGADDEFDAVTPIRRAGEFDAVTPIRRADDFDAVTPVWVESPEVTVTGEAAVPAADATPGEASSVADAPPRSRARVRHPTTPGPWRVRPPATPSPVALSPMLDGVLRAAGVLVVLGLGVLGLAQPHAILRGGAPWLGFLLFAFTGWGALVARIARIADPDAGLRAALGLAGYLAVAGALIAAGVLTQPVVLLVIAAGFAGFVWREITAPVALWQHVRSAIGYLRANPALGAIAVLLGAYAIARMAGAVAALDSHPPDDDLAYTPMVQRLLDAGDLIEPFSFRRLGAYGGQTALAALGAARGSLASIHLVDRGAGLGVTLLLLLGHARERRTQPLWVALITIVLLTLPEIAINTASYWTGAVLFFALYRCIARQHWALVGLTAAAAATLRQNFVVTAAIFVAVALVFRLAAPGRGALRETWRRERHHWAWVAGIGAAAIAPWCIASYASSATFLFPVISGHWNHDLVLRPAVVTWPQELGALFTACLEPVPITVLPVLAVVAAVVADRRPGRPLTALTIACALGLVLLVHGFIGSEPISLWRYCFGFTAPLAIALALELGGADGSTNGGPEDRIALVPLGRWIALAALVLQLVVERAAIAKQAQTLTEDLQHATARGHRVDSAVLGERQRYRALQAAIPAGARMVVMLDDPALLDYSRNAIANLDTPGYASPPPQLPAFRGPEPLRTYLLAAGYRYAAFVRSERSRYFFRREFWLSRIFADDEIFEVMAAYTIDAIDSFAQLAAATRVLYDRDGLVMLDLASPTQALATRPAAGDELARRSAWVRELAEREHLHDAWSLSTRADVRFEDGFTKLRFVDASIDDPQWYEVSHSHTLPQRGTAVLPMFKRSHLRVRGQAAMRLVLHAHASLNAVFSRPRLDAWLDGELIASQAADDTGGYLIDAVIPADRLRGDWHDLYLELSNLIDPDRELRDLRTARLESVEWAPP